MNANYKKIANWTLWGLVAIASLYLIVVLGYGFVSQLSGYPGATVAGVSVYGKNQAQIEKIVAEKAADYQKSQITFVGTKSETVDATSLGLQPDTAQTAKNVIAWSAANPFVLGSKKDFPIVFKAEPGALAQVVGKISDETSTPAVDPTLTLDGAEIKITSGSSGKRVNLAQTAANLFSSAGTLDKKVKIAEFNIEPSFTTSEAVAQMAEIKRATSNPLTLSALSEPMVIDQKTLVSWVSISGAQPIYGRIFGNDPLFSPLNGGLNSGSIFSSQKISDYLTVQGSKLNREPVNAQLAAQNGAVVVTTPSVNGQNLDVPASTVAILDALNTNNPNAKLVIDIKRPEVREDNLATLGLKELVSTGYSNFYGSPANRIHNVKVGAARFNGVLIKPGEEFSFNETLGPVDASTGYLPELVILENKTTKEFGGGMCQVSSTAFRAALNAGMPILERLYHAYPVSYYKPYGVDATIYLPKPDLVFKNDTGYYVLIQTHIEGYKLTFDFYGTKPARTITFAGSPDAVGAVPVVEQITPLIYDKEVRGKGSFTAQFWRFIYDSNGTLIKKSDWVSKYDSPDKFPH
jgi:vancomycin resistance protein YoaR